MKVLRHGRIEPRQAKCSICECVMEYTPGDIESTITTDESSFSILTCPDCGLDIHVPAWVLCEEIF